MASHLWEVTEATLQNVFTLNILEAMENSQHNIGPHFN